MAFTLQQRLRLAASILPGQGMTAAVVDAVLHCTDDEIDELAHTLIDRPSRPGYTALVRQAHRLDTDTWHRLADGSDLLSMVLKDCARERSPLVRGNALRLIAARRDHACVDAVAANLHEKDSKLTRLAADALFRIVEFALRRLATNLQLARPTTDVDDTWDDHADTQHDDQHDDRDTASPRDALAERLDTVLAEAVDRYPEHRQPRVLLAAALMSNHRGPALSLWFRDTGHPSHGAMRGVLKKIDDRNLARHALTWLDNEILAPQVRRHLVRLCQRRETFSLLLEQSHLSLIPIVHRRLRRIEGRVPSVPPLPTCQSLDALDQQRLGRWIMRAPLDDETRLARLADGLALSTREGRFAALRALIDLNTPESEDLVHSFCFDPDETVARIALRRVMRHRTPAVATLLRSLLRSPHASVRMLAAQTLDTVDFGTMWTAWSTRAVTVSIRVHARRCIEEDRVSIARNLNQKLEPGAGRDAHLCAIRMADDLGLAIDVEDALVRIANSRDVFVAATAVRALGRLRTAHARRVVTAALAHRDRRVLANAVESIDQNSLLEVRTRIEELTGSDDNRVRANAIKVLLDIDRRAGARELGAMLHDQRPMHRVSGLWVAETEALSECAGAVAQLANGDPCPPIRERAQHAAKALLSHVHVRATVDHAAPPRDGHDANTNARTEPHEPAA